MATVREIERRIRSVKNISQVTRALEAVSASRVRKAQAAVMATRPYAQEAWKILIGLSNQAGAGPQNLNRDRTDGGRARVEVGCQRKLHRHMVPNPLRRASGRALSNPDYILDKAAGPGHACAGPADGRRWIGRWL